MPEVGLFDGPLPVSRCRPPSSFPPGWVHQQVTMPARPGVDTFAGAVQLIAHGDEPMGDVPVAAAVRHWCGEDLGQLAVRSASVRELSDAESAVLRLGDLELHHPALLDTPGCPLAVVDDATTLLWTEAVRYRHGEDPVAGCVPYGQAVVRWLDRDPTQPVAHTMNMVGLGAASTREDAIEQACDEIVAQDAVMAWWMHGSAVHLPAATLPHGLQSSWGTSPLELRLRVLPTTVGVEVVLAVVLDAESEIATLAAGAGPDAPTRSTARALWQHAIAHDLASPSGSLTRSETPGMLPHRADRRYLDVAGPGRRRAGDPLAAIQLGLDPTVRERLDERTATIAPGQQSRKMSSTSLRGLLSCRHDVWVIDLTTPDVEAAGWHCVRALVPDMARVPVPAFPLDPDGRVATAAREYGWSPGTPEYLPYPGW